MEETSIFEGNELLETIDLSGLEGEFSFQGIDPNNKKISLPLSEDLLSKHLLIIGGIGTGKTNAFLQLISQLKKSLTPNDVMLIFDTKGDFYTEFYNKGDIVISNDEKATGSKGNNYWNIFEEIATDKQVEENIFEISKTLFYDKIQHTQQQFFPMAAKDIFSAILLHFIRKNDKTSMNNEALRKFLNESPAAAIRQLLTEHADLKSICSYIAEDKSPQTQGVISELQQLVREVFIGNFKKQGDLSIRKSIREKNAKTIFIEYDLGIGNVLTPIYRLLFDLAIKESLCRTKSEGNVYFLIDEFRLIPNLQHIDDGVNFGRSLGAKFIIGVQNIDQIFNSYGEALAKSILSGFSTTVSFRVNDLQTREFIKGIFGKNRKREIFMSKVQSKGLVEQIRDGNTVEDWDILNLGLGETIVGLPTLNPFRLRFSKYTG